MTAPRHCTLLATPLVDRVLASLTKHEVPELPEMPPMSGSDPRLAEYEVGTWVLLSCPEATPDLPVQRLHAAARNPALPPLLADPGRPGSRRISEARRSWAVSNRGNN